MSRYNLQWKPQGAIPQDVDLKVTLEDAPPDGAADAAAAAETPPAECAPCCSGLEFTSYVNLTQDNTVPDRWLYLCPAGSTGEFSAEIVANTVVCDDTDVLAWQLDTTRFPGGGLSITASGVDVDGHPIATLTGTGIVCDDTTTNEAEIWLTRNGQVFCWPIHFAPGCSAVPFYAASGDGLGPSSSFGQPPSLTFKSDGENVFVNVSVGGICPDTVITWNVDPSSCGIGYSTGTTVAPDDFISFGWVTFLTCPCSFTIEAIVDGVSLGIINVVCEP